MLPFFGLNRIAQRQSDEQSTPEALKALLQGFLQDLDKARIAIDAIEDRDSATFVLNVDDLWFDLNENGLRERHEDAASVMAPFLGRAAIRRAQANAKAKGNPTVIRFDTADIAWLMAYTHAMSATAQMALAFDPTEIIRNLNADRATLDDIPTLKPFYDIALVKADLLRLEAMLTNLNDKLRPLDEQIKSLRARRIALRKEDKSNERDAKNAELNDQFEKLGNDRRELSQSRRWITAEIQSLKAKLPTSKASDFDRTSQSFAPIIDGIYVLLKALDQQPDPVHLEAARGHWAQMIASNREFWTLVEGESDNDREWVPNPNQTSALGFEITQETAETWQHILEEADALVQGNLLIPHPLLPQGTGISLKAYFDDPSPLDLLAWVQGHAAYRYTQRGQRLSNQSWQRLQRLSSGNAALFAIFLN
ncbi:MAG: hypothetical protein WBC85_09850 [Planktotalea sp.]|uniref:hypothetical protein n=1 Tax=Planktotalea sp. TaxID=2029877 RepID=UPI003C73B43F